MQSLRFLRSCSKAGLLGIAMSISSQLAIAKHLECTGGEGPDAVFVRVVTEKGIAFVAKQSPDLPHYTMTCQREADLVLRCDGVGGRKLLLDNFEQARYFGARKTTTLTCAEVSCHPDCTQGLCQDRECKNFEDEGCCC